MTFIGASLIVLAQSAADNTVLSLKNVQVLYDRAIEAMRDVSLDVPAGAIVALLGSNGAGKSTILKAMSGMLDTKKGRSSTAASISTARKSPGARRARSSARLVAGAGGAACFRR